MTNTLIPEIEKLAAKTVFTVVPATLPQDLWDTVIPVFQTDYNRYYEGPVVAEKIKYFPGLLATLFYRISRELYLKDNESLALDYAGVGFSLSSIELYYSSDIGHSFKINHGVGTVIGAGTKIGHNALLHHNVTLGEKHGGRAELGNHVTIYPGATVVGGIKIGDHSIIGANLFVDISYGEHSNIVS